MLYVYLVSIVLSLVFTVIRVISPAAYLSFESADNFLSPLKWGLFFVVVVLFVMWVYRVHIDLRSVSKRYPISPGDSLAQILIPIYNIWGFWDIFTTLSAELRLAGEVLEGYGSDLHFWLILFYVIGFLSRFAAQIIVRQASASEDGASPKLIMIGIALQMILAFIWLAMTGTISKAIKSLVLIKQLQTSNKSISAT
jgi:hypothetical protein